MEKSLNLNLSADDDFYMPLAFRNLKNISQPNGVILAGDIGGTKSNLALYRFSGNQLKLLKEGTLPTKDFRSFSQLMAAFQGHSLPPINAICLGVAGPVNKGRVEGTNFSWAIDEEEIKKELGVEVVSVINDMEANAFGLGLLDQKDVEVLRKGAGIPGNAAIISPGTGLGEAGFFWDGSHYHPFPSEGGHCEFSPRNEFDYQLWRYLKDQFGFVSWERLVAGPGIYHLYRFLLQYRKAEEPQWLKERLRREDPSAVISSCAAMEKFPLCQETLELFLYYLAVEASQVTLKFKATGGIFLGGGILPKIHQVLDREVFLRNYLRSDRMNDLLESVPVTLILNPKASLYGAAFCAAMSLK